MTLSVTIRHDSPDHEKKLLIRVFEHGNHKTPWPTLIMQVLIEPGEEHSLYVWENRFFSTEEVSHDYKL